VDESSRRGLEATRLVVELSETILEVHVKELASGRASLLANDLHERGSDALPSGVQSHHRVLNPSMNQPIRDHVDKADETLFISCGNPAEAVSLKK